MVRLRNEGDAPAAGRYLLTLLASDDAGAQREVGAVERSIRLKPGAEWSIRLRFIAPTHLPAASYLLSV